MTWEEKKFGLFINCFPHLCERDIPPQNKNEGMNFYNIFFSVSLEWTLLINVYIVYMSYSVCVYIDR